MTDHRTQAQIDREARGMVLFNGQEITRAAYDRIRGIAPALSPYRVTLHEERGLDPIAFACSAEDDVHAAEQALDMYPDAIIIATNREEN